MATTINLDFVGLNTLVNEPVDSSTNTIGHSLGTTASAYINTVTIGDDNISIPHDDYFVALNIHRNGPYGTPIFKQIRAADNPLTRYQNRNNIFSYVTDQGRIRQSLKNNRVTNSFRERRSKLRQISEAPVYKNEPIIVVGSVTNIDPRTGKEVKQRVELKASFNNEIQYFGNKRTNRELEMDFEVAEAYEELTDLYLDGGLDSDDSPIDEIELIKYKTTIYPKEKNSYMNRIRNRENFSFPWHSVRKQRERFHVQSAFGYNVMTQSVWPLDPGIFFSGSFPVGPLHSSGPQPDLKRDDSNSNNALYAEAVNDQENTNAGGPGALMNAYCHYPKTNYSTHSEDDDLDVDMGLSASVLYTLPHDISVVTSVYYKHGFYPPIVDQEVAAGNMYGVSASYSGLNLNHGISFRNWSLNKAVSGYALWEADKMSGKTPFYDSYADYSETIRCLGSDHTLVPEFKISDHVESILKSGLDSKRYSSALFSVTGANDLLNNSNTRAFFNVFSTTDFLKNFELVQSDHESFADTFKITLKCNAIKKFLPYDGFYAVQRTIKIAEQFFSDIKDNLEFRSNPDTASRRKTSTGNAKAQAIIYPLFAPGVLYNTIKSGVAVDFPLIGEYSSSLQGKVDNLKSFVRNNANSSNALNHPNAQSNFVFNYKFKERVPFEALLDPGAYLSNRFINFANNIYWLYETDSKTKWNGQTSEIYSKMINNFLAETADFFLEEEQFTKIVSLPQGDPNFGNAQVGKKYMMRLKMFRSVTGSKPLMSASNGIRYSYPQDSGSIKQTFMMYSRPTGFGQSNHAPFLSSSFRALAEQQADDEGDNILAQATTIGGSEIAFHRGRNMTFDAWSEFKFSGCENFSYNTGTYATSELADASVDGTPVNLTGALDDLICRGNHAYVGNISISGTNYQHTPPYFHGEAWADFTFIPKESKKYSLQELINSSSIEFYRYYKQIDLDTPHSASATRVHDQHYRLVNEEAVQLASSLNLRSKGITNKVESLSIDDSYRWIIQSKYETPMLNFNHIGFDDICPPPTAKNLRTVGMWHQYGVIPEPNEGVFLAVEDVPKSWLEGPMNQDPTNVSSLSKLCGFELKPKKMGVVKKKRPISEAVVAIPFIQRGGNRQFYKIPRRDITLAQKKPELVGETIVDMVNKMKKFVLPPSFDFVSNPRDVEPFSMYIFEFNHVLDRQDLADIWQGLSPDIGTSHEVAEASISHELLFHELLGPGAVLDKGPNGIILDKKQRFKKLPPRTKWLVFKVKQRASNSYFDKIFETKDNTQLEKRFQDDVSFNWPYDFFSLVELVKIDAEIDFANPDDQATQGQKTVIKPREKVPRPPGPTKEERLARAVLGEPQRDEPTIVTESLKKSNPKGGKAKRKETLRRKK